MNNEYGVYSRLECARKEILSVCSKYDVILEPTVDQRIKIRGASVDFKFHTVVTTELKQ